MVILMSQKLKSQYQVEIRFVVLSHTSDAQDEKFMYTGMLRDMKY
jgi:hypothetical protein